MRWLALALLFSLMLIGCNPIPVAPARRAIPSGQEASSGHQASSGQEAPSGDPSSSDQALAPEQEPGSGESSSVDLETPIPGRLAYERDGKVYIREDHAEREVGFGYGPSWSPDGQWLAYTGRDTQDGPYELRIISPDATLAYKYPELTAGSFAWSPVKPWLAVGTDQGLWMIRPGEAPTNLARDPGGIRSFAWAEDGMQIAYATTELRGERPPADTLWTIAAEGGQPQEVLHHETSALYPVQWSPEEGWLLFMVAALHSNSLAADGLPLMSAPLSGGEPRKLATMLFNPRWLSWTPDGKRFLATVGGGRQAWIGKSLAFCDLQNCTALPQPAGVVRFDGVVSPTGDRIAFVQAEARSGTDSGTGWLESRTLWVANPDGSGAQQLTAAGTGTYSPMWAKDGRRLLFAQGGSLWWIDTEGGSPIRVAALAQERGQGYYGQISAPVAWWQP